MPAARSKRPVNRSRRPQRRPARSSRDRLPFILVLAVALAAAGWAVVRLANGGGSSAPLAADDPGIAHVHGLGLNPADGTLNVATHFGTFRIGRDKTVQRLGSSFQDTMGFTVAGPNQFLGS